jgi:hypothetical protein
MATRRYWYVIYTVYRLGYLGVSVPLSAPGDLASHYLALDVDDGQLVLW